ncbi:hypothetical protein GIB67_004161 [Kingdonia uniflora]|uniref:Protein kinase domain-containing protein n=1 Tax=Kingdonia uniflora TaxID=39325 RepID=A0A7J7LMR5_9MAGN|nr:hypothetical protein GIB67_004161 [Kingdonia uniflora]
MKVSNILTILSSFELNFGVGILLFITSIAAQVISNYCDGLSKGFLFLFAFGTAVIPSILFIICIGKDFRLSAKFVYREYEKVLNPCIVTLFLYAFGISGVLFICNVLLVVFLDNSLHPNRILDFFCYLYTFVIPEENNFLYKKYSNQMKVALLGSITAVFYFYGLSESFRFLYATGVTGILFIVYVSPFFFYIFLYKGYNQQVQVIALLVLIITALSYAYDGLSKSFLFLYEFMSVTRILLGGLSMIFLFILYLFLAFHYKKYNNKSKVSILVGEIQHKDLNMLGSGGAMVRASKVDGLEAIEAGFVKKIHYEELKTATTNFSDKLGGGGSGQVFKGILKCRTLVAVKRIEREIYGEQEFLSELIATSSARHFNLIHVHGYCSHVSETSRFYYIVYDLFKNGSLDSWIFPGKDYPNGRFLNWKKRCKVAVDVAKALVYLHRDCGKQILHLDIKPENILVGDDFRGVLSDLGMCKQMSIDEKSFQTELTRGTFHYIAPEWNSGHAKEKSVDIFSYGKVLMDMFLGQRYVCFNKEGEDIFISGGNSQLEQRNSLAYVHKKLEEKRLLDLIDKRLLADEGVDERAVGYLVNVAIQCLNEDPKMRPCDMSKVLTMLEPVLKDFPEDK